MTDEEFLVWIANRLVNKYGESRDILDRTIKIVSKNRTIKKTSLENIKNHTIIIDNMIHYLTQLQKMNHNDIIVVKNEDIKFDNNCSLLDSVDIDAFLK
jgi:Ni,Fe-hydrogenase maturation factor